MFERSELRSRGEERMENGVKNLKGARLFPITFSNNGNGEKEFLLSQKRDICIIGKKIHRGERHGQLA